MAQELAAPLAAQLINIFGTSGPGSPGALNTPEILLGTVHRIALTNLRRIGFLQVCAELHYVAYLLCLGYGFVSTVAASLCRGLLLI